MFAVLNCQVWFTLGKHPCPVIRSQFVQHRYAAGIQSKTIHSQMYGHCKYSWNLIQTLIMQMSRGFDMYFRFACRKNIQCTLAAVYKFCFFSSCSTFITSHPSFSSNKKASACGICYLLHPNDVKRWCDFAGKQKGAVRHSRNPSFISSTWKG